MGKNMMGKIEDIADKLIDKIGRVAAGVDFSDASDLLKCVQALDTLFFIAREFEKEEKCQ